MSRKIVDHDLLHASFDYIERFLESVDERPSFPSAEAVENLSSLDMPLGEDGVAAMQVIQDLISIADPAIVTGVGGRYFGFVTGGVLPVALSARLIADGWDQGSALHLMSPVSAKVEEVVEKWVVDLLGLPPETIGGFTSGSSMASFCALLAARDSLLRGQGWDVSARGLFQAPVLRAVLPRNAHSSIMRALRMVGIGEEQVEFAPVDENGRVIVATLPELNDRTILILQAGDVNTGCFDDFANICPHARKAGAWIHIDGAFGLWAAASDRFAGLTKGMEGADSWVCDAHKTLNTPYACGLSLCRHPEEYRAAMATAAAYAPFGASGQRNGMELVPEMSRRARAVEIYAVLRTLGRKGVARLVEQFADRTAMMVALLAKEGFEIVNRPTFNQALVRWKDDERTLELLSSLQDSGECWCGPSRWNGKSVIRFSVCSWATTTEDIERAAKAFVSARENLG